VFDRPAPGDRRALKRIKTTGTVSRQMRWLAAQVAAGVALAIAAAGCGSHSSAPLIDPEPTTVGTLSASVAAKPLIREVGQVHAVAERDGGRTFQQVYALLNSAAAKKDVQVGAAMIRDQLPEVATKMAAGTKRVRGDLARLHLRTAGANAVRRLVLVVALDDAALVRRFAADVASARLTWAAVERFGTGNNALVAKDTQIVRHLMTQLRPADRTLFQKAVRQVYGPG
jgi:hypothetical protein